MFVFSDVVGLVTPDGELITDPDLQSEMSAAIYDGNTFLKSHVKRLRVHKRILWFVYNQQKIRL